ncbi:methyltransferase family protein [Cuneatibacter caecimuris]|uniref:Protein-S-isoprenylcysteine O-methyltransferase Ste14 n=1 Tax=Cuneatibacter caecimuris TaxID=1796618 RepID=A0A4Q7NYS6_9FIRM|nr:isoprenylcysteine carboxylmethyltransferase family protein [Cuneatibacter caecimuris]RZS92397.1 protein-S-isoprenylcysteine O-methyltransferase Ste14 [Cuneatibacter caecimuris]
MSAFLLLIPFFLIRFGLLAFLNKDSVTRAAMFAPVKGGEIPAYWVYQVSNGFILVSLCFQKIVIDFSWFFYAGIISYAVGLALCTGAVINFAVPRSKKFHDNGLYRYSRNPMYLAYFIFFAGCALLVRSAVLGVFVLLFIVSSHWIILSEERWCIMEFGDEYREYMKKVRRYIGMVP